MTWVYDDGGRSQYFAGKNAGDCVTRSIAIAMQRDYREIYDALTEANKVFSNGRSRKALKLRAAGPSPRDGVYREVYGPFIESQGWVWTPTMQIGSGCRVHLKADEMPAGRLIVRLSQHLTSMIDGVIHDTHDPSRGGTRCVYGYWSGPS